MSYKTLMAGSLIALCAVACKPDAPATEDATPPAGQQESAPAPQTAPQPAPQPQAQPAKVDYKNMKVSLWVGCIMRSSADDTWYASKPAEMKVSMADVDLGGPLSQDYEAFLRTKHDLGEYPSLASCFAGTESADVKKSMDGYLQRGISLGHPVVWVDYKGPNG